MGSAIICPAIIGLPIILLGTIVGVHNAKSAKRPVWKGAWAGAALGAILWIAFIVVSIFACLFCQ